MNGGQYIYPGELALLLGFLMLPAAAVAIALQAYFLHRMHILATSPRKAALGLLATLMLGTISAIAALLLGPASWGGVLGLHDLELFGQRWPVWPLGFVAFGAAAWLSTWLAVRKA